MKLDQFVDKDLDLLSEIARSALFSNADLRVAPASPGKAERLMPFIQTGHGTIYVNLEEAGVLCQKQFSNSGQAAEGLLSSGASRVLVTNGGSDASAGDQTRIITRTPPQVLVTRVTGAGDTFMAAHIAAETEGSPAEEALEKALMAAASYVSGEASL